MTYIGADGTVIEKRSFFRISLLSDIFFGVMDAVLLFGYSIWYPYRKVPRARQRASRDGGASVPTPKPRGGPNIKGMNNLPPPPARK